MKPVHVFFIRGISTYGHDQAKFSFIDLGPVHRHVEAGLRARGIDFFAVTGLGSGSLPVIADRAYAYLRQHPLWQDKDARIHLLGHSAGGLAARLLLDHLKANGEDGKIASLLTVAAPHGGSRLAEIFVNMPENHRGSAAFFKLIGYSVDKKRKFFEELTPQSLQKLFSHPGAVDVNTRIASIVCSLPKEKWCWPLKAFTAVPAYRDFNTPSDGIVDRDSQPFGDVIAELAIDHLRQAGFFGGDREFQQMLDLIAEYFRKEN